jgi:hypothetical protein
MASQSPKKGSQFAGAAAMFRQKESDMKKQTFTRELSSPNTPRTDSQFAGAAPMFNQRANASMSNINYSPTKDHKNKLSLSPPPFVSPGMRASSGWKSQKTMPSSSQFPTSSYLNKPSGTPSQVSKPKASVAGFGGGLHLSPSPATAKPKVNGQSWKDNYKGGISFQAHSPTPSSYLSKKKDYHVVSQLPETPDITIEVKIPDIDKRIRARRAAAMPPPQTRQENVPEHIRKFREREAAKQRALYEKEYRASTLLQTSFLGWKARAAYPALRKANEARLRKRREAEARKKREIQAAIAIQKTFRGYVPREEFRRRLAIKRRREKNKKEIKRIKKEVSHMPKKTKADIKELKKEHADRKKQMKKEMKKQLKEEESRLDNIKKNGHDQIEFLKAENQKIREQQAVVKSETKILEKQFEVLMAKAEETRRNFQSLQGWVAKENQTIQKNEIASQKCRHRYLPKYRGEMVGRNKHCIAEFRIKILYKARLHRIVQEILEKSSDPDMVEEAHEALVSCEGELNTMPEVPIPDGLMSWLK